MSDKVPLLAHPDKIYAPVSHSQPVYPHSARHRAPKIVAALLLAAALLFNPWTGLLHQRSAGTTKTPFEGPSVDVSERRKAYYT